MRQDLGADGQRALVDVEVGRMERVAGTIQRGHTQVTSGVYRVIRHPSYLGLVVGSLGWSLAFRSSVGIVLTALLIPVLVARINAEERLLRGSFGDEYEAYRARTSRLIPGVY